MNDGASSGRCDNWWLRCNAHSNEQNVRNTSFNWRARAWRKMERGFAERGETRLNNCPDGDSIRTLTEWRISFFKFWKNSRKKHVEMRSNISVNARRAIHSLACVLLQNEPVRSLAHQSLRGWTWKSKIMLSEMNAPSNLLKKTASSKLV